MGRVSAALLPILQRQTLLRIAALFAGVAMLVACAAPRLGVPTSSAGKGLKVMTTFVPITLLTLAVVGDCAEVKALIPANTGPHDFSAKPGDLAALGQAQVLVKNGLGMESFLDKLVASAENPTLITIDSSRGVATLDSSEGANHDDGHDHNQSHAHSEVNPHIWLDPLRAIQQVETIRDGLVKADPGCAAVYRRNAEAYTTQLMALNIEIAGQLKAYRGKTFVASHGFAPYFAERYGLKVDFLVDVPETNPSPADLQRVVGEVQRTQLKALLSEPQEGHRSFNALAEDLGIKIGLFDPMETASEQASRDPLTYFTVMRRNVANLSQAFGE